MNLDSIHPQSRLTLREAFELLYDHEDLKPNTIRKMRHELASWERLTPNPPVGEIDNATLAAFRQAAIDAGLAARTINGTWTTIRSILRRLAPPFTGNPWGLSVIERVPAMKRVKQVHRKPRRLKLDDISKAYVACRIATIPQIGFPSCDWWRCLIVLAYTTGLRKGDLFNLEADDIDLENGVLSFTAEKTGKEDDFPLHPAAVNHIRRIMPPQGKLFRGPYVRGGRFYKIWHEILDHAGVERFGLHDLRRTAASEIDRIERGLGKVFLQHTPRNVTETFYVNASEELRDAIHEMRLPVGFQAGPKMCDRADQKAQRQRLALSQSDFDVPSFPVATDWKFAPGAFCYRGRWYKLTGAKLRALRILVEAERPIGRDELQPAVSKDGEPTDMQRLGRIHVTLSTLRKALRDAFGLSRDYDPVPCTTIHRENGGGQWTVWIPPSVNAQSKGGAA